MATNRTCLCVGREVGKGEAPVSETDLFALMDSRITVNYMSSQVEERLSLQSKPARKVWTVVNGRRSDDFGRMMEFEVLFVWMEVKVDFVIPSDVPLVVATRFPAQKRLDELLTSRQKKRASTIAINVL